jgi:hypothetical protein
MKTMKTLSTYKDLAKQAYSKKPLKDIDDWHLITSDNNNKVYQNRRTLEVVNAISGSKSAKDFVNDGLQYIGLRNNRLQKQRYNESAEMMDRLNAIRRPPKISTASHSLGSNVANRLLTDGKVTGTNYNFNPYYASQEDNLQTDRIVNVRNSNDFASRMARNNRNTIEIKSPMNSIESHFLDNLKLIEQPAP